MSSLGPSIVLAAILGLIPARIAASKGRNFALWWFYGWMLLIVAIPHSLLLRPANARPTGTPLPAPPPWSPPMAACPSCGQTIRADTPQCPFCGHAVAG